MKVKYKTHIKDQGWQPEFSDGEVGGTIGECKAIEFININLEGVENLGVTYQVHCSEVGWQNPVINGQDAGVLGQQIEAIIIDLFGEAKDQYDIIYRCHIQDYGWLNWTRNGQQSGSVGGGKRMEAIQIYFAEKNKLHFEVQSTDTVKDLTPPPVVVPAPTSTESEDSMRARVVATAQSYVGYVESSNNTSIFGKRHGDPTGEWCHYYVWSVYEDCGLEKLIPQTGYCPTGVKWFKNHPTAYYRARGTYTPKPGDVIYFDWEPNGEPNHVGLVEGCDGSTICTIEGNSGSPPTVRRKYWSVNDWKVLGFGVPDFSLA